MSRRVQPLAILKGLEDAGAITPTSLKLVDDLSIERVGQIAAWLGTLRDATAWYIGDLLVYANALYGDESYQIAESTGRTPDRLADYFRVSSGVDAHRRKLGLSWTHHRHVAKLPADEQDHWLNVAVNERLTSHELLERIRGQKDSADSRSGTGERQPVVVLEAVEQAARRIAGVGVRDGDHVRVPVEPWERLLAALGEE